MARPIHIVPLDKSRPAVILTRRTMLPVMDRVTIAPITSTVKGLGSEVPVGPRNGLDHDCAVTLDNIATIPVARIGRFVGMLLDDQEDQLAAAIAFALELRFDA